MVTDATLKVLLSFISANSDRYAIYDVDYSIIATNDEEFFTGFLNSVKRPSQLAVDSKIFFPYVTRNTTHSIAVSPYYKTKNKIGCYILATKNDESYVLSPCASFSATDNSNYVVKQLQSIRTSLNNIVNINEIISEDPFLKKNYPDAAQMLKSQLKYITSCLAKNMNLLTVFSDFSAEESTSEDVELVKFLNIVCGEISDIFQSDNHTLVADIPDDYAYARIKPKLFLIALANILQNAVEYSPKGSEIYISLLIERSTCSIVVKNKRKNVRLTDAAEEKMGMGRYAIKKVICYDCGGKCSFNTDGDTETVTATFTRIKKPYKEKFNSHMREYVKDRYKSLHLFLDGDIEENE